MKKIVYIIPDLNLGGAEIMLENLAIEMIKQGYNVLVVSLYSTETIISKRLMLNNVSIIYLDKKRGLDIKLVYSLYKLFKVEKPDIVHSHLYAMPYGMIPALLANIQLKIHTIHSLAKKEVGSRKRKINKILYKYFRVIPVSISPQVKKTVVEEYNISENNVPMIYNGIDLSKCIEKTDYRIQGNKISILHVGNFKEAKNHIGLIESFKLVNDKIPNVVLHLIGSGTLEKEMKNQAIELGLQNKIIFHGMQPDVYSYLAKADIFVLPSLWEGMPISLIEAMAFGLPIVATNVGGITDMIKNNESGLVVDFTSNKVSDAICEMIKNENMRESLGREARNQAMIFSSENMAIQYINLYKSITNFNSKYR